MSYSLNETESLCRKAARGAGFSWGLADEAGRAVRWLEARGLPGAQVLAELLQDRDNTYAPKIARAGWVAETGALCPISTGAALCDHAFLLGAAPIKIGAILWPVLLVPFAASVGRALDTTIALETSDGVSLIRDDIFSIGLADRPRIEGLTLSTTNAMPDAAQDRHSRAHIPPALYRILDAFAQHTYAPATEASRLAGAGAGLTDND